MDHNKHNLYPYGTYVLIWCGLLALTGATVTATALRLGAFSIHGAILIALCKASLVVMFFMNLKQESTVFKVMLGVALLTLATILGLTFVDVSYR